MRGAGPVAALVMYTVDPRGLKLAAWRGAQRVNDAADLLADGAMQGHASRGLLLSAPHDGVVRRELRRQMWRCEAAGVRLCLAPIERGPEVGATGAARDAGIPHGARDYTSLACSRYKQKEFASRICCGVRQLGSKRCGLPTRMHSAFARDVATFRRLAL